MACGHETHCASVSFHGIRDKSKIEKSDYSFRTCCKIFIIFPLLTVLIQRFFVLKGVQHTLPSSLAPVTTFNRFTASTNTHTLRHTASTNTHIFTHTAFTNKHTHAYTAFTNNYTHTHTVFTNNHTQTHTVFSNNHTLTHTDNRDQERSSIEKNSAGAGAATATVDEIDVFQ